MQPYQRMRPSHTVRIYLLAVEYANIKDTVFMTMVRDLGPCFCSHCVAIDVAQSECRRILVRACSKGLSQEVIDECELFAIIEVQSNLVQ